MKEVSKQEAVEEKKGEIKKIEKTNRKKMMMMKKNIKKNCLIMCMDLINSDDNIDELFGISVFNNGVIRFRIYTDFKKKNDLIENDIDHKIELLEDDDQTFIKTSRVEKGEVTNE